MDISTLINQNKENIHLSMNVSLSDLQTFAKTVAAATVAELKDELRPREPKLYTPKEVMEIFNYCSTTLWNRERAGLITGFKDGNRKYYKQEEIDRLTKKP